MTMPLYRLRKAIEAMRLAVEAMELSLIHI